MSVCRPRRRRHRLAILEPCASRTRASPSRCSPPAPSCSSSWWRRPPWRRPPRASRAAASSPRPLEGVVIYRVPAVGGGLAHQGSRVGRAKKTHTGVRVFCVQSSSAQVRWPDCVPPRLFYRAPASTLCLPSLSRSLTLCPEVERQPHHPARLDRVDQRLRLGNGGEHTQVTRVVGWRSTDEDQACFRPSTPVVDQNLIRCKAVVLVDAAHAHDLLRPIIVSVVIRLQFNGNIESDKIPVN